MQKLKRMIVTFAIIGVVLGGIEVMAAVVSGPTIKCSLGGAKSVDSDFMDSSGHYYTLSMTCSSNSAYGTMSVLRGRPVYYQSAEWLMYPALKCSKGGKNSGKYDVYTYAKNHAHQFGSANYSNQVSIRLYGNHCDNQKKGCYGSATATNTNS